MGLLIFILLVAIIVFSAYQMTDSDESNVILKLIGYCILANFNFRFNHGIPLPLGFVLYLIILHPKENIRAKRFAAYAGFALYLLALLQYLFIQ